MHRRLSWAGGVAGVGWGATLAILLGQEAGLGNAVVMSTVCLLLGATVATILRNRINQRPLEPRSRGPLTAIGTFVGFLLYVTFSETVAVPLMMGILSGLGAGMAFWSPLLREPTS